MLGIHLTFQKFYLVVRIRNYEQLPCVFMFLKDWKHQFKIQSFFPSQRSVSSFHLNNQCICLNHQGA